MTESRKIWKAGARTAQYYCARVFAWFLAIFAGLTPLGAAPAKPDPLLDPPTICTDGVVSADLSNGRDAYGRPVPPPTQPQPGPTLAGGVVTVPVRAPTGRRLDLPLDISGLLQPPLPACLTPEQARENTPPPKPVPKR